MMARRHQENQRSLPDRCSRCGLTHKVMRRMKEAITPRRISMMEPADHLEQTDPIQAKRSSAPGDSVCCKIAEHWPSPSASLHPTVCAAHAGRCCWRR
jgi:hypothetical protein